MTATDYVRRSQPIPATEFFGDPGGWDRAIVLLGEDEYDDEVKMMCPGHIDAAEFTRRYHARAGDAQPGDVATGIKHAWVLFDRHEQSGCLARDVEDQVPGRDCYCQPRAGDEGCHVWHVAASTPDATPVTFAYRASFDGPPPSLDALHNRVPVTLLLNCADAARRTETEGEPVAPGLVITLRNPGDPAQGYALTHAPSGLRLPCPPGLVDDTSITEFRTWARGVVALTLDVDWTSPAEVLTAGDRSKRLAAASLAACDGAQ